MYKALELTVNGRLIRGVLRAPEGNGPFPTVIFFHGFTTSFDCVLTVWKNEPKKGNKTSSTRMPRTFW